jgi:hypothetical protein
MATGKDRAGCPQFKEVEKLMVSATEREKEAIAQIQRECPLVCLSVKMEAAQWTFRGYRKDEIVIEVKGLYFKPTRDKFYNGYAKLKGMLGPNAEPEFKA